MNTLRVARGSKIQIYNPEGELIHTFDSLIDPTRDNEFVPNASRNMILSAIEKGALYKRYRWVRLDRQLPDDTIQILTLTLDSVSSQRGDIAMLNLAKTKIEMVFCDQKEAAEDRQFKCIAPISKAVRMSTQSGGHYFKYWFDCDQSMKEEYIARGGIMPDKRVRSNAIKIQKLDPVSNNVVATYSSIEEVIKEFRVTRTSLKSAAENGQIVGGFHWKIVE